MNRIKDFQREVEEYCKKLNAKAIMKAEPKKIYAEICWDLSNSYFDWSWTKHQTYKGLEKDFIKNISGFEVCKKSNSSIHLVIGEKDLSNDCFIIGKYKNVWLKAIN
jgi:hypothetical protein